MGNSFRPTHKWENKFEEYYTGVEKEVYRDASITQHYKETEIRVQITNDKKMALMEKLIPEVAQLVLHWSEITYDEPKFTAVRAQNRQEGLELTKASQVVECAMMRIKSNQHRLLVQKSEEIIDATNEQENVKLLIIQMLTQRGFCVNIQQNKIIIKIHWCLGEVSDSGYGFKWRDILVLVVGLLLLQCLMLLTFCYWK